MANIIKKLNTGQVIEENDPVLGTAAADLITITAGKAASYTAGTIQSIVNENTSSFGNVTITADKYSTVTLNQVNATKVGNIKINAALDAEVDVTVGAINTAPTSAVGTITVDAAASSDVDLTINAFVAVDTSTNATTSGKSATVGNVLLNSNGAESNASLNLVAGTSKIGTVSLNAKGFEADVYINASSSGTLTAANTLQGGSIGNVVLNATGINTYTGADFNVSAVGGTAALTGRIGNITATASGKDSEVESESVNANNANIGNITAVASAFNSQVNFDDIATFGGNVGNVSLTASGYDADVDVSIQTTAKPGTTEGSILGGNIGNVGVKATGASAYVNYFIGATGGFSANDEFEVDTFKSAVNIGNVTVDVTGVDAQSEGTIDGDNGVNIGNIIINNKANGAETSLNASAEVGNIKNVTVNNIGLGAETSLSVSATSALDNSTVPVRIGGNIGNVVLNTSGTGATISSANISADTADTTGVNGKIGNVSISATGISAQNQSSISAGGNIGTVTLANKGLGARVDSNITSTFGSIGAVTANASGGLFSQTEVDVNAQNGNVSSINLSTTAFSNLSSSINAQSVGAVTVKANGENSAVSFGGTILGKNDDGDLVGGTVGNINLSATGTNANFELGLNVGGIVQSNATDYTLANTAKMGNISSTVAGNDASGSINIFAGNLNRLGVDIGNITAKVSGVSASQNINVTTGAGNIGNVSLNLAGNEAGAQVNLSARSLSANDGKIGNLSLVATGLDTNVSANLTAYTSIGTLTSSTNGAGSSFFGNVNLEEGATMGNTTLNVKGDDASSNTTINGYDGADVGNIALNLQGGTDVNGRVNLFLQGTTTNAATVGNITAVANNANASGNDVYIGVNNSTNIGNITGTVTGGDTALLEVYAFAVANTLEGSGTIGNITLNNTAELSRTTLTANASNIGDVTLKATGVQSAFNINLNNSSPTAVNIGAVDVTLSTDLTGQTNAAGEISYFNAGQINISNADNVNGIKVTGGSATSQVNLNVDSSTVSESVDFGGFNGFASIILGSVDTGVDVIGAKGGNFIVATVDNDVITTGAGADTIITQGGLDTIKFLKVATGNVLDTINDFTAGSDKLDFAKLGLGASGSVFTAGEALNAGRFVPSANGVIVGNEDFAVFVYNTTTGVLSYDADGGSDGAAIEIVTLTGAPAITAADIFIS